MTAHLFAEYPHKRKMSKKYNSRQGLWRFVTINLTAIILFSVMKLNSFQDVPYFFVLVQMMNEHICSALFLHRSDQGVPKEFSHQRLPQYTSLQRCVAVRENSFFSTLHAATVIMVDSNIQRENILPSEKAFAYKMKLDQ